MKYHYLLWLKSNRGTNVKVIIELKAKPTKGKLQDLLEEWADNFPAMRHGDNVVHYGYRRVRVPERKELLRRYRVACKSYERAREKQAILAEMLNPTRHS